MEKVATASARIKEAMADADKKAADIVEATGIPKSTMSRYISGAYEPKSEAAYKIAQYLGVAEMWLLGYDVPRERTDVQKKNDAIVDVVTKLRSDPDFFEVVTALAELSPTEYASIKQIISALGRK